MINMELAKQRGISQENIQAINTLHTLLERLIQSYTLDVPYQEARDLVRSAEFTLQRLWQFSVDERYHTWYKRLEYRYLELKYAGKTFKCTATGHTKTIEECQCFPKSFIVIGDSALDMGVPGSYHRMIGNLVEVV